ncbi:MAG: hypothetical protein K6A65_08920, partial [Succinivibrionaceae bacterium]|nr:hypothetical protein [Succinivibrionaceae bacterium]
MKMHNTTRPRDPRRDIALVPIPLRERIKSNRKFVGMLLHILSGVEDFRQPMRVRHSLENIPCICLLLAMRGKLTS